MSNFKIIQSKISQLEQLKHELLIAQGNLPLGFRNDETKHIDKDLANLIAKITEKIDHLVNCPKCNGSKQIEVEN